MSTSRQRAADLLSAYNRSLEQQIVGQGSNLPCRDEELWKQVEAPLRDGDAKETHCLGLDPLRVMEESLTAASLTTMPMAANKGGHVRRRGGLQGLAKAFEVLEQAALNLYLCPWRNEYKVVKMYSGMFTHYIKPVLSMPQIEKLFGLLGYQLSSSRHEQLFLQTLRSGSSYLDDLLRWSCAFYAARCECRLLRKALGKNAGDVQWELSVVRERQRGNSLQVALDNTKKTLMGTFEEEADMDLYTDELNGQKDATDDDNVGIDDGNPHSLTWPTPRGASPHGSVNVNGNVNDTTSNRDGNNVWVSTLRCQLTKTPLEPTNKRQDKGEATEAESTLLCRCLEGRHYYIKRCIVCKTLHNVTCPLLDFCLMEGHGVVNHDDNEEMRESGMVAQSESNSNATQPPSLPLQPITYHDCCDLSQPDPEIMCSDCNVFHSASCRETEFCQRHHDVKHLGVCSCGKACPRKPLVLCRYCGKEYCRDCWYRNPMTCSCGQTFDQSSSV